MMLLHDEFTKKDTDKLNTVKLLEIGVLTVCEAQQLG